MNGDRLLSNRELRDLLNRARIFETEEEAEQARVQYQQLHRVDAYWMGCRTVTQEWWVLLVQGRFLTDEDFADLEPNDD